MRLKHYTAQPRSPGFQPNMITEDVALIGRQPPSVYLILHTALTLHDAASCPMLQLLHVYCKPRLNPQVHLLHADCTREPGLPTAAATAHHRLPSPIADPSLPPTLHPTLHPVGFIPAALLIPIIPRGPKGGTLPSPMDCKPQLCSPSPKKRGSSRAENAGA